MAWLNGWQYRTLKIVNGTSAGAQTNYQMKITIQAGVGADTSTTMYLNNLGSFTNFQDIRFTDSTGNTLISYWFDITTLVLGTSVDVWIQIPSIPASPSTTTIYLYYSNGAATDASNGLNTFVLFDDFSSGNLDYWTQYSGSWLASISSVWSSTTSDIYSCALSGSSFNDDGIKKTVNVTNLKIIADAKITSTGGIGIYTDTTGQWILQAIGTVINWESSAITAAQPLDIILRKGEFSSPSSMVGYVDRIRVRNYVNPEPTFGASGQIEIVPTMRFMT